MVRMPNSHVWQDHRLHQRIGIEALGGKGRVEETFLNL